MKKLNEQRSEATIANLDPNLLNSKSKLLDQVVYNKPKYTYVIT